jgi:hypothetical protein
MMAAGQMDCTEVFGTNGQIMVNTQQQPESPDESVPVSRYAAVHVMRGLQYTENTPRPCLLYYTSLNMQQNRLFLIQNLIKVSFNLIQIALVLS